MTTTNATSTASPFEICVQYIDTATRFIVLGTGVCYFILVMAFKHLRKITFFQMHHVNFIGLIQGIILSAWSFNIYPALGNKILDEVFCFVSEILWGTLKNARAYAVLVLALYRYGAIFKASSYKKVSES